MSLFGRLEIEETLWLESGRTTRPFRDQLEIRCRGVSIPAERAICDFGSERAYAKASKQMKEHYGIEPPTSMIAACCMRVGTSLALEEDTSAATRLPCSGADLLLLEIDGTMIPTILEQASSGDKRKGKKLGYKEMRLIAAQDMDKSDPVFAAGYYGVEEAGSVWSRCALKAGWSMSTLTHAVIDGAQWIRAQHDIHFSSFGRALSDCYHVCEYLGAAFPDKQSYAAHKSRLLQENVDQTLYELRTLASKEDSNQELRPAESALRYLENRSENLFYAQAREQGLPIGSGLIESGHRHVLQCRLKLPGSWWKEQNANAMAKLRAVKANNKWDDLWKIKKAA